ncbi:MAG TPA: zinc ABC transporter substrate-binding protein [Actinomycetota bacterium]|nr:zinc ABC transporter substrate-binding protein [Actinomycetota bacterium]
MRTWVPLGLLIALLAAACGSAATPATADGGTTAGAPGAPGAPPTVLSVVAAENFWGSLVSQLAGRAGHVTSIVSDPNADPHSYESSAADARAFATADYVVENGAGYDAWADRLLSGNPSPHRKVLNVATLLGRKPGDNPHFWYDPAAVPAVIARMEADLVALAPRDAAYLAAQQHALTRAFAPERATLSEIKSQFAGTPIAATESIVVPLATALGLDVVSPPQFMNAVSEGNDPPAPSVTTFQQQVTGRQGRVLVYNQQTATQVTTTIKNLAGRTGIPLVAVTETIQPPGTPFQVWFGKELSALEGGLQKASPAP